MRNVFTNGCFDVIHVAHIRLLEFAKKQGDHLIVGLNSDRSVKSLKGNGRPFFHQQDRKEFLESIRFVDEVIIFDEETPYELIKKLRPDIIIKGGDYKDEDVVGSDIAKVVIFPFENGYSTSNILKDK
jgi:D-beta-D-heptose 7-phosphate kinase/D-beta-D-heptose 1-phosphate adenosyltransferase